uniref:TSP1_CCN domain-containing protein n=1 Tax=Ascaris lumbricoides TaxID=6252 RepID=A0A0M3HYS7_ASCLU
MNNPRVRTLAILNIFLGLVCIFLFVSLLCFATYIVLMKIEILSRRERQNPCLYQWTEWSACSATCKSGEADPFRTRTVLRESIIQARGSRFSPCPKNLEEIVDRAPCNVYLCPKPLSSFQKWTECFYVDAELGRRGGCYKIRILPFMEQLIYIDTDVLHQPCTEDECENGADLTNPTAIRRDPLQNTTPRRKIDDSSEFVSAIAAIRYLLENTTSSPRIDGSSDLMNVTATFTQSRILL